MLLRKFCLPRNFLRISRVLRPDLVNKNFQQVRFESIKTKKYREAEFLAQFVPNYWPNKNETILDDGFKIQNNYSDKSPEEMVKIFERLSLHCHAMDSSISEVQYDPIVNAVIEKMPEMTDDEVVKVLADLTRFPQSSSPRAHNYSELWNKIDDECWTRSKYWKFATLLKVMNAYYRLGINKVSAFNKKALLKIAGKIEHVPPRMLVEFMFYQSIIRHKEVSMYLIERRVKEFINEFDIDELGIIGLAFFKREAKILDSELLDKFYERLLNDIDDVKDITLVNFLKIMRYSSKPSHCKYMNKLNDELFKRVDKYNYLTLLHITLLGINLQNCHQELIVKIIEKINSCIKQVRLKDLERMSHVISLYDIETESGIEIEFMKNVLEELKIRVEEITNHPRCFTSTLHYLSLKGVYDVELISAALKENFLKFAYGKNLKTYTREILCLESYTKINLKGIYHGPELSERIRKTIATLQSMYIPYRGQPYKLTYTDKLILDVKDFAEYKFGENLLTQILPHYDRPDIIYCLDETGKSITSQLVDCFQPRDVHTGNIYTKEFVLSQKPELAAQIDKLRLFAIVVGGWNFYLRDTQKPTGSLKMKLEQLRLIGYNPVLIFWNDWANRQLHIKEDIFMKKMNAAFSN